LRTFGLCAARLGQEIGSHRFGVSRALRGEAGPIDGCDQTAPAAARRRNADLPLGDLLWGGLSANG
jgi:hypothetical protein